MTRIAIVIEAYLFTLRQGTSPSLGAEYSMTDQISRPLRPGDGVICQGRSVILPDMRLILEPWSPRHLPLHREESHDPFREAFVELDEWSPDKSDMSDRTDLLWSVTGQWTGSGISVSHVVDMGAAWPFGFRQLPSTPMGHHISATEAIHNLDQHTDEWRIVASSGNGTGDREVWFLWLTTGATEWLDQTAVDGLNFRVWIAPS